MHQPRRQTPEGLVKADIRRTAKTIGLFMVPIVGGPLQPPGLPDYIAIYKGRFVGIECKAGKNKLSQHQERMKGEIEAAGGLFIVAYSGADVLKALGYDLLF